MMNLSVSTGVTALQNNIKLSASEPKKVNFSGASDSFKLQDKKDLYLEKLNKLFPNNELTEIYNNINKDLGIDYPPQLKFYGDNDGVQAGGYVFSKNEVQMSLSDLLETDTKIVGIKNGKRVPLVSPKEHLPLFVSKQNAMMFVELQSKQGNLGFDELVIEPTTPEEQRKLVIQKLAHEVIHAQQHMIMRRTDGIGEKEILKAWTHEKPKNMIEKAILDIKTNEMYKNSYWAGKETSIIFKKDTTQGYLANIWLEAVRNYPPVTSPEYSRNPLETDAYLRAAQYVEKMKY